MLNEKVPCFINCSSVNTSSNSDLAVVSLGYGQKDEEIVWLVNTVSSAYFRKDLIEGLFKSLNEQVQLEAMASLKKLMTK